MAAEEGASAGIGRRSFLALMALALAAIGGQRHGHGAEKTMANVADASSQRLLDLARRRGRLPVIVGLAAAGASADDEEAAIARTQRQLLADLGVVAAADGSLAGPGITGVKLYETIPFLALTVDADALARLIRNPLVVSIREDSAVPPG